MNLEKPACKIDIGRYALTFNPHDTYQFVDSSERFTRFQNLVNELLLDALDKYDIPYVFYIELSEPMECNYLSLGPRLHIHGTVEFKKSEQVFNFLLSSMYQFTRYGIIKLKEITDEEKWENYCMKQQHIIRTPPIEPIKVRAKAKKQQDAVDAQRAIDLMFNVATIKPRTGRKPI